jgi:hypothetical protein
MEHSMMVNGNWTRVRLTAMLVPGAVAAVAALAAGGVAGAAQQSQTIQSGAGSQWPKTIQSSDFVRRVDNPWYPLIPGMRWFYRGFDGDTRTVDRQRVTHRKKRIEGVRTTVVHDEVLIHHKPREVTRDFYAQDRHGNVWYFGENTKELDRHGNVISREGSFQAGRDGARPGVYISAHAKLGDKARQEDYQGHAKDHFKVIDRNAHVSVPYVTTNHAVRTKEWSPLEPNVLDNKFYVLGLGSVREIAVKGPVERLHLVRFAR